MDDNENSLLSLIKTNKNSFYKFLLKNEGYNNTIQHILNKMDKESSHISSDQLVRWICSSSCGIFSDKIIKDSVGFLNTESIHKFIIKLTYLFVHFKSRNKIYSLLPKVTQVPNNLKLGFYETLNNCGFVELINYIKISLVKIAGGSQASTPSPQLPPGQYQPTWTASLFLTSPTVNSYKDILNVSFTKYFFPIIINAIAFYELYPKGSINLLYDPEGAFQSKLSSIIINAPSVKDEINISALGKFLQILHFHQSQFNDYEEILAHKIRTKLSIIIRQTFSELNCVLPDTLTFEFLFIYLLNKCAPSSNQLLIFRYIVSNYFRTKDGHRLGTNLKNIPENSNEVPGLGFIGQSMRFFFLRQKKFMIQEKTHCPPSFCLFMDAHTFGFCTATYHVVEAFRENYIKRKSLLIDEIPSQYLFSHNYNYSRQWHTPLPTNFTSKYEHQRKSPICGFVCVIGDNTAKDSTLMSDNDYQETFGRILTFREKPLGRPKNTCDLDYGNDEFLIGHMFQKYSDPRQNQIIYFPMHYFHGPHNIFNIDQEENEQIIMKRIFRVCYSKLANTPFLSPKNKLLQIRDIKKYLLTNSLFPDRTPIPFYFKYCIPQDLNFVSSYACSENIMYPHLGTGGSLAELDDDIQVGLNHWKIPDKYVGFKILQDLKLNIHNLFFENIMTTWLTDYILPEKVQANILIKTLEDYRFFYYNIFKHISTNSLLPQFFEIASLRNFRILKLSTSSKTRRQVRIKNIVTNTQKNLIVKVIR